MKTIEEVLEENPNIWAPEAWGEGRYDIRFEPGDVRFTPTLLREEKDVYTRLLMRTLDADVAAKLTGAWCRWMQDSLVREHCYTPYVGSTFDPTTHSSWWKIRQGLDAQARADFLKRHRQLYDHVMKNIANSMPGHDRPWCECARCVDDKSAVASFWTKAVAKVTNDLKVRKRRAAKIKLPRRP